MAGTLEIRPAATSFARRSPAEVEELLAQAGGRAGAPWQVPTGDGGRLSVRLEARDGELIAIHLEPEGGPACAREGLALAARLAARLHWNVIDSSGAAWDATRLQRRLRGGRGGLRSLLTVLGGVMAVVCGFVWATERGLAPVWLMLALLGLLLYAAMRTWGWLERRLVKAGGARSGPEGGVE